MVSRSESEAKRRGSQESVAMFDITRGPSTKPAWAADDKESAFGEEGNKGDETAQRPARRPRRRGRR